MNPLVITSLTGLALLHLSTVIAVWNLRKDMNEAKRNVWLHAGEVLP